MLQNVLVVENLSVLQYATLAEFEHSCDTESQCYVGKSSSLKKNSVRSFQMKV